MLQCVAVCCVCFNMQVRVSVGSDFLGRACGVLRCVAVCCSMLQCVAHVAVHE